MALKERGETSTRGFELRNKKMLLPMQDHACPFLHSRTLIGVKFRWFLLGDYPQISVASA